MDNTGALTEMEKTRLAAIGGAPFHRTKQMLSKLGAAGYLPLLDADRQYPQTLILVQAQNGALFRNGGPLPGAWRAVVGRSR